MPEQGTTLDGNGVAMLQAMQAAYLRANRPTTAQLDLTYRCDLDCQHCYLDDRRTWPELTTREWLNVLDQLAELGVWKVNFSGGEVMLRRDFVELLQAAVERGFRTSFRSHGGLLDDATVARIAELGVEDVTLSFYSLRPEVHDAFTRQPGSQMRTLQAISRLRAAGANVIVDVVVQSATIEEIPALNQYFADLGCVVEFGTNIYRDHLGRTNLDLLELTSEERVRARQLIWTHQPPSVEVHATVAESLDRGPCGAGRTYLYISPDGAVWPCVMFPMQIGHLKEHRLVDIWEHSPERAALAKWTNADRTGCIDCGGSSHCFYCPGEAYKNTGDFRTPPPQFHNRTRDHLRGWELAKGTQFPAEVWRSVPAAGQRLQPPGKFVFPIYRPSRHGGVRVHDVPREQ